MPNYKLYYFPGKGRAETARMMFKLKDVPFEDIRLEGEKWQEFKPKTPLGQMPVLEVDGKALCQSLAIQRYVARTLGLYGSNTWESAQIDMIIDTCEDMAKWILPAFGKTDEEKAAIFKPVIEEKAPPMLQKVENLVQASGFCVGNQITWADIQMFNMFALSEDMGCKLPVDSKQHPKMTKMLNHVKTNPKIMEWISTRPVTKF